MLFRSDRPLSRSVVGAIGACLTLLLACSPSAPAVQPTTAPTAQPAPTSAAAPAAQPTTPPQLAPTTAPTAASAAQPTSQPAAKPAAAAQPSSAPAGLIKFRAGVASAATPALPNSVIWLAKDLGFYEKEGLDVDVVPLSGTPQVASALIAGELDIGNIGTDDVLRLAAQGVDIKGLHSPDPKQYFMIVGKSSVGSVKDLPGTTYGVASRGSLDYTLSRTVMTKLGVDPEALTYVSIGEPSLRAKALVAGQIDATTMSIGTWVTIEKQPGVKVLVNVDDYYNAAPVVAKVNAATGKTIREKPDALRRYTAAILDASRAFASDENLWVDGMAKARPDISKDQLEELWQAFKHSWAVNGYQNLAANQATAEYYYGTAAFKDVPHVPVDQWNDTEFVDAYLKQHGVDPRMDDPGRSVQ